MILTTDFIIEKPKLKFDSTEDLLFENILPKQIGFYAVDKSEYIRLQKSVKPDILQETYISVYELVLQGDLIKVKHNELGNKVILGKRRIGDLKMVDTSLELDVCLNSL